MRPNALLVVVSLVPAVASAGASRFTGVWEGTPTGANRGRNVVLVCRPRGDSGVAGTFYVDGAVHAGVGTVLGRGHVTVFDGREHGGQPFLVLSSGARVDLRARAVS